MDPHDLQRFVSAQEEIYSQVLSELRDNRKQSHWMWYIFPQVAGLGISPTSRFFAISSRDEARAYANHEILGARLDECTTLTLAARTDVARMIFGHDDVKFRSSLTLFAMCADEPEVFRQALEKFFEGRLDRRTVSILAELDAHPD